MTREKCNRLHIDERLSNGTTQTSPRVSGSSILNRATLKSEFDQTDKDKLKCMSKWSCLGSDGGCLLTHHSTALMQRHQEWCLTRKIFPTCTTCLRYPGHTDGAHVCTFDSSDLPGLLPSRWKCRARRHRLRRESRTMEVILGLSKLAQIRRDGGIHDGGWNHEHGQALFSGSKGQVTRDAVKLGE